MTNTTPTTKSTLASLELHVAAHNGTVHVNHSGTGFASVAVTSNDSSFCQFSVELNLRVRNNRTHVACNLQSLVRGVQGRVCKDTGKHTVTAPSSLAKAVHAQVTECTRVRTERRALNARRARVALRKAAAFEAGK